MALTVHPPIPQVHHRPHPPSLRIQHKTPLLLHNKVVVGPSQPHVVDQVYESVNLDVEGMHHLLFQVERRIHRPVIE